MVFFGMVKKQIEIMEVYRIKKAYHWQRDKGFIEIEITSENLLYTEMGDTHSGCQCNNLDNQKAIREKCKQVADLIREIDKLNK